MIQFAAFLVVFFLFFEAPWLVGLIGIIYGLVHFL